jgi:hypothetical protein
MCPNKILSNEEYRKLNKKIRPEFYACELCHVIIHPSERRKHDLENHPEYKCELCEIKVYVQDKAKHEESTTHQKIGRMQKELEWYKNKRSLLREERKKFIRNHERITCPCTDRSIQYVNYSNHIKTKKHKTMMEALRTIINKIHVNETKEEFIKKAEERSMDLNDNVSPSTYLDKIKSVKSRVFWCGVCRRNVQLNMKEYHWTCQEHLMNKANLIHKENLSCDLPLDELFND